jgi:hypothetical protein
MYLQSAFIFRVIRELARSCRVRRWHAVGKAKREPRFGIGDPYRQTDRLTPGFA